MPPIDSQAEDLIVEGKMKLTAALLTIQGLKSHTDSLPEHSPFVDALFILEDSLKEAREKFDQVPEV